MVKSVTGKRTDNKAGKGKEEYEYPPFLTRALLIDLPLRSNERRDVSPSALRALPRNAGLKAVKTTARNPPCQ